MTAPRMSQPGTAGRCLCQAACRQPHGAGHRQDRIGRPEAAQRNRGRCMAKANRLVQRPALVQPEDHAGGKGIAGTIGSDDRFRRHIHRRHEHRGTIARQHDGALGKMRHQKPHRPHLHHGIRRCDHLADIGRFGRDRGSAGNRRHLEVIDDQVVQMRQAGSHDPRQLVGRNRAKLHVRLYSGGLRRPQHRDPAVFVRAPGAVHLAVDARQAKVQKPRLRGGEVEMIGVQFGAGALQIDMRAPPGPVRGIGIGIVGPQALHDMQAAALDAEGVGLGQQDPAIFVIPDDADGLDRNARVQPLQVDGQIAARPAALHVFGQDLDHLVFQRPELHHLVVIGAPGSRRQNAPPRCHFSTASVMSRSSSRLRFGRMPFLASRS